MIKSVLAAALLALACVSARAETCIASTYGRESGPQTASGERFNPNAMTCAHRSARFGTLLRVTLLSSGASITCRVNDRGPFVAGRCVDLATGAARALGLSGIGRVSVQ